MKNQSFWRSLKDKIKRELKLAITMPLEEKMELAFYAFVAAVYLMIVSNP